MSRRRSMPFGSATAALLGMVSACQSVLGIEDWHPMPDDAAGGVSAAGAVGGAKGGSTGAPGGGTVAAPDGGSAGDAGHAGATTGGSGGAFAEGGMSPGGTLGEGGSSSGGTFAEGGKSAGGTFAEGGRSAGGTLGAGGKSGGGAPANGGTVANGGTLTNGGALTSGGTTSKGGAPSNGGALTGSGGAPTCSGASTQACGNCGQQSRTCTSGTWSSWSSCANQGECAPSDTQSCGTGTKTCGSTCKYGSCVCPSGSLLCGSSCVNVLTDSDNCGGCGLACSTGCSQGRCRSVVSNLSFERANMMVVSGSRIFWFRNGGMPNSARCYSVSLSSGTGEGERIADEFHDLVADGDGFFASTSLLGHRPAGGKILRWPSGSDIEIGNASPEGLAVDATNLYFAVSAGSIWKVAKAGGTPTAIASGLDKPGALAVDATNAYFSEASGSISKVDLRGGTPTLLARSQQVAQAVVLAGGNLFWSDGGDVKRVATAGNALKTLGRESVAARSNLATDGQSAYWVTRAGNLQKSADGETSQAIASSVDASLIAVDSTSLYWIDANASSSTLWKLHKLTPK